MGGPTELASSSPAGGVEYPDADTNQAKSSNQQGAAITTLTEAMAACLQQECETL